MFRFFSRLFVTKSDVPLDSAGAARFLPILMGLMIYLATLALLSSVGALHLSQSQNDLLGVAEWETMAAAMQIFGVVMCCLIAGAAILTIAFATLSGIALHHSVVKTLLLLGARDPYIALQFQAYAMQLGWRGTLIGNGLTLISLLILKASLKPQTLDFLGKALSLTEVGFAMVLTTGLILTLIALTARMTVLSYLARS
ncbi:MAG: hypothetical protein ACK5O7_00585 [Holosporales bacterium]